MNATITLFAFFLAAPALSSTAADCAAERAKGKTTLWAVHESAGAPAQLGEACINDRAAHMLTEGAPR